MSRTKVKLDVTEMKDAEVRYISLVQRASTRIPFRILKSEDGQMIDLSSIFSVKKAEPKKPSLAAIVVAKSADVEKFQATVAEAGFTVDKVDSESNELANILMLKSDAISTEAMTFKMSEDVAVVVEDVQKAFQAWDSGSKFSENIKKQGFFPGLALACETLRDTVSSIMWSAEKSDEASSNIKSALKEFNGYVTALVETIPPTAFKSESFVVEKAQAGTNGLTTEGGNEGSMSEELREEPGSALEAEGECANLATGEKCAEGEGDDEGATAAASVGKTEDCACDGEAEDGVCKACGGKKPAKKDELTVEDTSLVTNAIRDQLAAALDAFKSELTTALAPIQEQMTELKSEIASTKDLAAKAEEIARTTILGEPNADGETATKKAEVVVKDIFADALQFPGFEKE